MATSKLPSLGEIDRRNVIERMFCRLKHWRRIATRYDPSRQKLPLHRRPPRNHLFLAPLIESAT